MERRQGKRWRWISVALFLGACSPSRFLAPGEQLVAREPLLRGHVLEETPPLYVRSNSRSLGIRLGLQLYFGGLLLQESPRFPYKQLRQVPKLRYYTYIAGQALREKLGEPPALLSQKALDQDVRLLEEAYIREGYFQAVIQPQVKVLSRSDVQVIYRIRPGPRWIITEFATEGKDTALVQLASRFLEGQGLPVGEPFRLARLDALREALHKHFLAEGYYGLPLSSLTWRVDTTTGHPTTSSSKGLLRRWLGIERKEGPSCRVTLVLPAQAQRYKWAGSEIALHTSEGTPTEVSQKGGVRLVVEPRAWTIVEPAVLVNRLYFPPQPYYDQRAVQASQRALQNLEVVQWVSPSVQGIGADSLKVRYEVVVRPPLEVALGVEGFQSTQPLLGSLPLPGASANLRVAHLSLFRRGWPLRMRGQAAVSYFRRTPDAPPLFLYNLAGELTLTLPERTLRLANAAPRPLSGTLSQNQQYLALAYQDVRQVDFSRRYATFSWSRRTRFLFEDRRQEEQVWTPFSVTFVDSRFSPVFEAQIEALSPLVRSLILRDYLPRLTQVTAWQVSSNRNYFQSTQGHGDYSSLLIELGGAVPFFLEHLMVLTRPQWDSTYRDNFLFNRLRYGVFLRFLAEVRYRRTLLSPKQQLFMRVRLGMGQGLYYTIDLPFENRFFVGGPNSMRAWQFGALGPGRYAFPQNLFLIPGGNFLAEANVELRQYLFRGLQLAPFVDVGNVWFGTVTNFEDPRGILEKNPLPGVGAGVGLRWDFSVLVIRLDVAQQVFDPASGWVRRDFPLGGSRSQYVFAIGYPF
ncbi:MAG: membrane protein [Bacteroidia bacterium]|nr:MAG: membrane protein [Bacteroidia bacterium]